MNKSALFSKGEVTENRNSLENTNVAERETSGDKELAAGRRRGGTVPRKDADLIAIVISLNYF